jgi:tryptophan 2,3-dioxygenase
MHYFKHRSPLPKEALNRDVSQPWNESAAVQEVLITIHRNDPEASLVGEALVDLDEGFQEWRYRHVKMVERTIGRCREQVARVGLAILPALCFAQFFLICGQLEASFSQSSLGLTLLGGKTSCLSRIV